MFSLSECYNNTLCNVQDNKLLQDGMSVFYFLTISHLHFSYPGRILEDRFVMDFIPPIPSFGITGIMCLLLATLSSSQISTIDSDMMIIREIS